MTAMMNPLAAALEVDHDPVVEARSAGDVYRVYRARRGQAWALYHEGGVATACYAEHLGTLLRVVRARVPERIQKEIALGLLRVVTRAA